MRHWFALCLLKHNEKEINFSIVLWINVEIGSLFTSHWTSAQHDCWHAITLRGKLGNGEHLSFEAYKYKENIIHVMIIMLHKEHINFYPEAHFYRHSCSRFEVMAHKRRWHRSAITCIAGGKCERIYMCNGCVRLPNFDLLIISLSMERILFVSYWFTTDPYAVAY